MILALLPSILLYIIAGIFIGIPFRNYFGDSEKTTPYIIAVLLWPLFILPLIWEFYGEQKR